ncbi:MAG: hypothetical protein V7L01_23340 [Nostoc sp.]|uniref:hypothetical protein n=1 Tax=Nostoc sp. TaxID=1180 RepID=UPI002FFBED62
MEILIFPFLRLEAVGIPLETASAMGFAALETMDSAFITPSRSHRNLLIFIS